MGVNVHSACLIKFDSCLLEFDTSFRRKFFICSWVKVHFEQNFEIVEFNERSEG